MTQVPVFDPGAVARIIDPDIWKSVDYRVLAVSRAKAAAIMALHAADPDRQMADAEAALWREHDARHDSNVRTPGSNIWSLRRMATEGEYSSAEEAIFDDAAVELSRLRADLADVVGVLEKLIAHHDSWKTASDGFMGNKALRTATASPTAPNDRATEDPEPLPEPLPPKTEGA